MDFETTLEIGTINASPLALDIYCSQALVTESNTTLLKQMSSDIQQLWPIFLDLIQQQNIPQALALNPDNAQTWEVDLSLVTNDEIQHLNATHRQKDTATDVLSFCLFAESQTVSTPWAKLPVIQLGAIYIALPWAEIEHPKEQLTLRQYLLSRFFHGCLHLLGAHHDTMADFERVKSIQEATLQHYQH